MNVGLSVYDMTAPDLLALGMAADEAGFDALWLGEHLLLPVDYASEHPTQSASVHEHIKGPIVSPDTELVDPLVGLAAVAGATSRVRLATGIYILPLRHPLVTARAVATIHEVSAGRFLLGIGAGWLEEEFSALTVPFDERRTRLAESIEVMRAAWEGKPFEHHGRHFSFGRIQLGTRPVDVPIIMGGNTPKALERAARLGDGWFSSGTPDLADARRLHTTLQELREAQGGGAPFRCYFRIPSGAPDVVDSYRSAGIDDVVVWADQLWPKAGTATEKRSSFLRAAADLGLA